MSTNKTSLNATIGIATYYGAPSIIDTVASIYTSAKPAKPTVIVCVDGNPLKPKLKKALQNLGAQVVLSKTRGGQVARINQMIKLADTDLFILAQDDIIWDKNCYRQVIQAFDNNPKLTMSGLNDSPAPAQTLFEKIIESSFAAKNWLANNWRDGDNYLHASGRGLAFRTQWIKKWQLPEKVINSDAMLYFLNKQAGGLFTYLENAIVYNPLPQTLDEHTKQAKKFAISKRENEYFLKTDLEQEYQIPKMKKIQALLVGFLHNPLLFPVYLLINIYAHFAGRNLFQESTGIWDTDISTKRAISQTL